MCREMNKGNRTTTATNSGTQWTKSEMRRVKALQDILVHVAHIWCVHRTCIESSKRVYRDGFISKVILKNKNKKAAKCAYNNRPFYVCIPSKPLTKQIPLKFIIIFSDVFFSSFSSKWIKYTETKKND